MSQTELKLKKAWRARRWACLVGINNYQDSSIIDLHCCVNDARVLYNFFTSRSEYGYQQDRMRLLLGQDQADLAATRLNILASLIELAKATSNDDLLLFYFAGHGQVINGEAYLLPVDSGSNLLLDTAISLKRIKEIVQDAQARAKVIILDACYAGTKLRNRSPLQENELFVKSVFEEAEGIAILASSTRDELAWEDSEKGHGIFTYYLLEGLAGAANYRPDQYITLNEIATYVTEKVKSWADQHHTIQRPTLDFKGVGEVVLLASAAMRAGTVEDQLGEELPEIERPNPVGREFPTAVREKKDFYDRRLELKRIKEVLNATTDKPIMIQGERGIGKTSLLNSVRRLLTEERWPGRQFFYCSVEPGSIFSCADFAGEMWHALQSSLSKARGTPSSETETLFRFDTFSRFGVQLGELMTHRADTTCVVFIDEFDKIVHQCNDLEQKRILGLMRYIVEAIEIPLVFFLSILQDLPTFYGSPFPVEKIILHPFDRADIDEMVRGLLKGYATISESGLTWLEGYTGGHPYFIKLLLSKLFEAHLLNQEEQIITPEMWQAAAQLARQSVRADSIMSDIYRTYLNDDERYILLWLASSPDRVLAAREVVEAGAQLASVFERLVRRNYLIRQIDGSYCFKVGLQNDWLHDWPEFEVELERLQVPGQSPPPPVYKATLANDALTQIVPGGICIDLTAQRLYLEGKKIENELTDLEYRALVYLAERSGQVVTKDEFANHVWGEPYYEGDDQRILQLIHRLRNLLKDKERPYKYLETLRKRGFRLQQATLVHTSLNNNLKG